LVGGFCFIVLKWICSSSSFIRQFLHQAPKFKGSSGKAKSKKQKRKSGFEKLGRVECVFYEPMEKNEPKI
jgi:hypothetical protein